MFLYLCYAKHVVENASLLIQEILASNAGKLLIIVLAKLPGTLGSERLVLLIILRFFRRSDVVEPRAA